jgi:hypothetical protein
VKHGEPDDLWEFEREGSLKKSLRHRDFERVAPELCGTSIKAGNDISGVVVSAPADSDFTLATRSMLDCPTLVRAPMPKTLQF